METMLGSLLRCFWCILWRKYSATYRPGICTTASPAGRTVSCGTSPQEVRRTQMKIFVLAKWRYYTSFWLPGPETLFPIDLHGERVVCKSLDNFF